MIVPADIARKEFNTTRLKEGYDQLEVDDFLDRVSESYSSVVAERDQLIREATSLRKRLEVASSEAPTSVLPLTPAGGAERILVAAQRTADMVEAEANSEAGKIRAAARAEADNVRSTAEAERQKILNQLETERVDLEEKIQALRNKRATYKGWLKATLSSIEEEEVRDA